MHNAWWWNNAVDAPHRAQTAIRQNLWGVTAQSGPVWSGPVQPVDERRAWRISRATKHINESLHLTFRRHVFWTDLPVKCGGLDKVTFGICEEAHVCACAIQQAEKSNGGGDKGGFFIFHWPLSDNLREMNREETWCHRWRVLYSPLFQVSGSSRGEVPTLKAQLHIWYHLISFEQTFASWSPPLRNYMNTFKATICSMTRYFTDDEVRWLLQVSIRSKRRTSCAPGKSRQWCFQFLFFQTKFWFQILMKLSLLCRLR